MAKSNVRSPMTGFNRNVSLNAPNAVLGRNPMVEHGDVPQTPTSVGIKFPTTVDVAYGDPKLNTPMGKGIKFRRPQGKDKIGRIPEKA